MMNDVAKCAICFSVISMHVYIKKKIKKRENPPLKETLELESTHTNLSPVFPHNFPLTSLIQWSTIVLCAFSPTIWYPHYHTLRVHMGNL